MAGHIFKAEFSWRKSSGKQKRQEGQKRQKHLGLVAFFALFALFVSPSKIKERSQGYKCAPTSAG
jgi:hypothetical protein